MTWALNLSLDVELFGAWNDDPHPCFVWVLNMIDCIILGSMDIGQEVNKQAFPLDVLDKLMICEVNEPSGAVLALEALCRQIRSCHSPTRSVPQGSHTLSGICAARAVVFHAS